MASSAGNIGASNRFVGASKYIALGGAEEERKRASQIYACEIPVRGPICICTRVSACSFPTQIFHFYPHLLFLFFVRLAFLFDYSLYVNLGVCMAAEMYPTHFLGEPLFFLLFLLDFDFI